ncbi:MAG: cytochrome c [Flavobacteriales bacterium]|nr:cytochrome c [Flavobacteriales bacterium]
MKSLLTITFIGTLLLGEWVAPESAKELKNPFALDDEKAIKKGGKIFGQLCWTCHGKTGKGDGPAGVNLQPTPSDFSSINLQKQSDGELFWKITNGKGVMLSYEDLLSDKQRWQLVNFIRTLKE